MDCSRFRERLEAFRAGRLDAAAAAEVAAHRDTCPDCARLARGQARPPRLVAAGFLGAFAASVFTLIYTGLHVRDAPVEGEETPGRAAGPEREPPAAGAEPAGAAAAAGDDTKPAEEGEDEPAAAHNGR